MLEHYLDLDHESALSLQEQLRAGITQAIAAGHLPLEKRLPSSRQLSQQLGVARNTVVKVYEQLSEEGMLHNRARSGYFINPEFQLPQAPQESQSIGLDWQAYMKGVKPAPAISAPAPAKPPSYSFIYGQPDQDAFPVHEWRKCSLRVMNRRSSASWTTDSASDAELIEQIRSRILPRRGIFASPDEVMLTIGTQQGLYLLSQLLTNSESLVGLEEPGYPEARRIFALRDAELRSLPVDKEGIRPGVALTDCDLVYTTPSHQFPTTVSLSQSRRQALLQQAEHDDFLIIEDDYEHETNFINAPVPALKSETNSERVIYLSSLSRVLAPGLRIGIMVAAPELIQRAKELRGLMIRQVPANNLSTLSLFLSLGYYDALMQKLIGIYRSKWQVMEDSLNYYFPHTGARPAFGGAAFWIEGPKELDSDLFCELAREHGILIESGSPFYADGGKRNCFRLGFAAIPIDQIRDGIANLARVMHQLLPPEHIDQAKGTHYRGQKLHELLSDNHLLASDCYHVNFTIDFHADGSMSGFSQHPDDIDHGIWWIAGDRWCRQWQRWQFAEQRSFAVVVHGRIIKWYDEEGWCVNQGVLRRPPEELIGSLEVG